MSIKYFKFFLVLMIIFELDIVNLKKIVFSFKEIENNNIKNNTSEDITSFFNQLYYTNIYSKIKIGQPEKELSITFNSEETNMKIKNIEEIRNNEDLINYNLTESKTFKNITSINGERFTHGYSIINETIKLYTDINNKNIKEIKDYQLEFLDKYNSTNKSLSCIIGLKNTKNDNNTLIFMNQLINKNIIDSNIITFNYTSDKEGNIFIGEYPHIYRPDIFYESKSIKITITNYLYNSNFQVKMDYVYIKYKNSRTFLADTDIVFYIENNIIIASDGYQLVIKKYFFDDKINNGICSENKIILNDDDYYSIICKDNNSLQLQNFPTLYLEMNGKTFILDYKDLFKKVNNTYYFLVLFNPSITYWKIGNIFLKKYQITIDNDKNIFTFYNNKEEEENNDSSNALIIIIIIIVIILLIAIGIVVYIKFIKNKGNKSEDIQNINGPVLSDKMIESS